MNPYKKNFSDQHHIERRQDKLLLKKILANDSYLYILGPHRLGKTSLVFHAVTKIKQQNDYFPIYIDISLFSAKTYEKFFKQFLEALSKELKINDNQNFTNLDELIKTALSGNPKKIIIFLDEISYVKKYKNDADDFFSKIRAMFNQRIMNEEFYRIMFVLVGSTKVKDLVTNPDISPFNISDSIDLESLSFDELRTLVTHGHFTNPDNITKKVYFYTRGNLYLSRLILKSLYQNKSERKAKSISFIVKEIVESSDENLNKIFENANHAIKEYRTKYPQKTFRRHLVEHLYFLQILQKKGKKYIFSNPIYKKVFGYNAKLEIADYTRGGYKTLLRQILVCYLLLVGIIAFVGISILLYLFSLYEEVKPYDRVKQELSVCVNQKCNKKVKGFSVKEGAFEIRCPSCSGNSKHLQKSKKAYLNLGILALYIMERKRCEDCKTLGVKLFEIKELLPCGSCPKYTCNECYDEQINYDYNSENKKQRCESCQNGYIVKNSLAIDFTYFKIICPFAHSKCSKCSGRGFHIEKSYITCEKCSFNKKIMEEKYENLQKELNKLHENFHFRKSSQEIISLLAKDALIKGQWKMFVENYGKDNIEKILGMHLLELYNHINRQIESAH